MGSWKKSIGSRYLSRAFGSASDPDLPTGGLASNQAESETHLEQQSGEQQSQQAAPATSRSGSRSLLTRLKRRFPSRSRGEHHNNTTAQRIAASASQSLVVSAGLPVRPHSSYSEASTIQMHGPSPCDLSPLTAGGITTAGDNVTGVSLGDDSSPSDDIHPPPSASISAPIIQVSYSQSEPIASENPASPSTCAPHTPASSCQVQASAKIDIQPAVQPQAKPIPGLDVIEPLSHSSIVWAKALQVAKKKLEDSNLPQLDLTNLTSQSAEENIQAVIKALNTLLEGDKRKRWSYTWRGKEVIIVERLGRILRIVEKYSKAVDMAIQSNPQVSALVWAGVCAIMRVCISYH